MRPVVLSDPPKLGVYHGNVINGIQISGQCNGIFFLKLERCIPPDESERVLLLWNPAIRQVFKIPSLDDVYRHGCLGFGFESVTNDYKVVCFDGIDPYVGSMGKKVVVAIYSLAANCWRHLDDMTMNLLGYGGDSITCYKVNSISTGRKSHWIFTDNGSVYRPENIDFLLSFDMVDEVFVQTRMPYDDRIAYFDQGSNSMYPTIYTLDEGSKFDSIIIWVLKEYGPSGYWTKQRSIVIPPPFTVSCTPFMVLRNNNSSIVFLNNERVKSYDLVKRQMKSLYFPTDAGLLAYTESLVSVLPPAHRLDQQQQQQQQQQPPHTEDEIDDDASSVDSAFMEPAEPSFITTKKEWLEIVNLPYCVRELYQPINSNSCTF